MSPGMKKRIRAGAYTFPDKEWSKVSTEGKNKNNCLSEIKCLASFALLFFRVPAKKLIHDMFETSTDKRITIDDIMSNKWICVSKHLR